MSKRLLERPVSREGTSERLAVSLKTLAQMLDASRSSVRRWLAEAGIKPVAIGSGVNGAIRYRWEEVEAWLDSREHVS
jgi:predicted DNA-binding transcriptional regulator AlpA